MSKMLLVFTIPFIALSLWAQETEEVAPKKSKFSLLAKDVFFQPGAGLRVRYDFLDSATGGAFPADERETQATHRANFDFKIYKGEYIETFFRLINTAEWGGSSGDTNGGQKNGFKTNNGMLVNQAWGLWKFDDLIGLKFGRVPLDYGLGYTYGLNDWFNVPYSFDLFEFIFDWESIELAVVMAKVQELTKVTGQTTSADPEENHLIINLDINNLVDSLNVFNFSLVQVNRDLGSSDAGVTVLDGLNMQRLALELEVKGRNVFGSAFVTYVTGTQKLAPANRTTGTDNPTISQAAFDLKGGYQFSTANNLRLWTGFHFDSGDSNKNDDTVQSYDSFYYDVYGQSGLMDLIRWGNLSFYRFGLDVELFEGLTVGSEWLELSKSEAADGVQFGQAGRFLQSQITAGGITLGPGTELGSEFDIWLDYNFNSGMTLRSTVSAFFPGGVFEKATATSGSAPSASVTQVLVQLGYAF